MMSIQSDPCYGTGYAKRRENAETIPRPPRRYRRALDRATRRHTVSEEIRERPIFPSSLGHKSIQQASYNKSAAKSCRLIKLQRGNTISLPDIFTSYNPNLNELDGLDPLCFKKNNNNNYYYDQSLPTDSSLLSLTLTTRKQRPSPSSSPTFEKQYPQSIRSSTLPKAVNSFFNSIKDHSVPSFFHGAAMKGLTKEKSATTTSGKAKKKRPSIFSFFSRKKRTETKPHSTLDDNVSHGGSELNFDEVVVPKETAIPTPVRSKKTFRAPLPPTEENKENVKESPRKRLSNASSGPPKFSRQASIRSSRKSFGRRKAQNSKTKKGDETKSINSSDAAPSDPPPPIPPPLETCIDDVVPMSQFTPSNYTMIKNQAPVEFLTKSVEITPVLLDVDKSVFKVKQQRQQNPVSEKKEKKQEAVVEITTDMIFTSSPPQPKSSPKQTKPNEEVKVPETPPAIPQSAPPDPIAFATALSFTSPKQSSAPAVKRLSNFGLSAAKVPPIPVSTFEDSTDSSSESGNSTTITMPVYTNLDIKHQLHFEHKKLLSLFEEWEMLRRPRYNTNEDGHAYANSMVKQEAVLRQHAVVTSLYNQLLAPVVSNNSSPASTIRFKPAPPRHIINSNPPTLSRGYVPSLFKSRSTFDVNAENNNIRKEPERNYNIGNYSPRISQTKRYSAGDALNPMRPRLGSSETPENSSSARYDKKYVVEQKPVTRNVPIMMSAAPKLSSVQIITETKRNNPPPQSYYTNSPPMNRRTTPMPVAKQNENVEPKKENIEVKKPMFNSMVKKNPSPLLKSKTLEKTTVQLPPPPVYSPRLNHQDYYANSPPTTRRENAITNGYHSAHSPPVRQISLPEVIQKAAKPPTPVQQKKTPVLKPLPKESTQANNGDLLSSISAFPNVTLRSVPKPVEKSFNLGRVLENGERPSTQYRDMESESYNKVPDKGRASTSGPPPPPPPPAAMPLKKPNIKQTPPSSANGDALRGDMLAEIRKAGGIQFLRSISSK